MRITRSRHLLSCLLPGRTLVRGGTGIIDRCIAQFQFLGVNMGWFFFGPRVVEVIVIKSCSSGSGMFLLLGAQLILSAFLLVRLL